MKQLLSDLDVTPSFSRPRVSNDNPFSEAQVKTMKYGPKYPNRFTSFEPARAFCRHFFQWYNEEHRHSGVAYLTPTDVHLGRADSLVAQRQEVMNAAYARTHRSASLRVSLASHVHPKPCGSTRRKTVQRLS